MDASVMTADQMELEALEKLLDILCRARMPKNPEEQLLIIARIRHCRMRIEELQESIKKELTFGYCLVVKGGNEDSAMVRIMAENKLWDCLLRDEVPKIEVKVQDTCLGKACGVKVHAWVSDQLVQLELDGDKVQLGGYLFKLMTDETCLRKWFHRKYDAQGIHNNGFYE